MNHVTRSEKENLVRIAKSKGITLNGEQATLNNIKDKHPVVCTPNDSHTINWKIVRDTINNNNGHFVS